MSRSSRGERGYRAAVVEDESAPYPVAFLIHDLQPGGAEQVFLTYLNGARRVDPVGVVVRRRPGLEGDLSPDVPLYDLDSPDLRPVSRPAAEALPPAGTQGFVASALGPVALVRKAFRLGRVLEAQGVDAVSTFLHKSHAIALFLKLIVRSELRVVVNVHEVPSQHIPRHFGPVGRVLMTLMTRFALPRADLIVAVADGVERDLVERYRVPSERVVVLRNPVLPGRIEEGGRAPLDHPFFDEAGPPVVVGVGRLVPLKGFDVLLDAIAPMALTNDVRVVLVGDGPEGAALRDRARVLGIEGAVSFVGYDPNPWRYMARADVFVLSSLTEALPNVLAEALVLGVPTVASACSPGVSEYLGDEGAGLLVPPGDPAALRQALDRVLGDAELRTRLAERARARGRALPGAAQIDRYEETVLSVVRPGAGAR